MNENKLELYRQYEMQLTRKGEDAYASAINDLIAEVRRLQRESDEWKAEARRQYERRVYDSPDAYNARINEAVRHLREQDENGIRS